MVAEREVPAEWMASWPGPGEPVDAPVQDRPHLDCGTESWRFAADLRDDDGEELQLLVTFLSHRTTRPDGSPLTSYGCSWSTADGATYRAETWRDVGAVELTCLDASRSCDPSVAEAVWEACSGGQPIAPDQVFPGPVRLAAGALRLDFGGIAELSGDADGTYRIVLRGDRESWLLRLRPLKPAVTESVRLGAPLSVDEACYTYVVPRLAVEATRSRPGRRDAAMFGEAMYRHAFGAAELPQADAHPPIDHSRTWAGLHLDNGWEVVAVHSRTADLVGGVADRPASVVLVAPDGTRHEAPARLTGSASWGSMTTLNFYPTEWRIESPQAGLSLRARARFPEQERHVVFGLGSQLDGGATAEGTLHGRPVRGSGWLEVLPVTRIRDFERHMERLREITHAELVRVYPDTPEPAAIAALTGMDPDEGWPVDLVADPLHRSLVVPVRHMADAMGKGWRSYAALAAMEMLGVDSRPYQELTALVELLHTASLIVDDVEDSAPTRRGRPAVHTVFGPAIAINAGTHAYFVFDQVVRRLLPDDPRQRLRLYEAYLGGLRRSHAGQALDIIGHHDAMDAAVATGDAGTVLQRVRTTHRLKTGGVVRGVGEFGAVLGGADDERFAAISAYYEAVGLAYQINDDIADLLGLLASPGDATARVARVAGEDIREAKVTLPLAHAVARLPQPRLREVWEVVRAGGADPVAAVRVAEALRDCGAVAAALADARQVIDQAWKPLQDLLPLNRHTVMIRALGIYAAQRYLDE